MSDIRFHFLFALPLGVVLALGGGCKAQDKADKPDDLPLTSQSPTTRPARAADVPPPRNPRSSMRVDEQTLSLPQSSVAVTQGPTPLVYIFDNAASIRVVDMTTGAQLAAIDVQPRTLVRVDDIHGVTVGSDNIAPGRLTPGHQYVIYSDPTTPNTIRHGVGRPIDMPKR